MSSLSRGDFHPLLSTSSTTTTFLTDLSMGVAHGSEKYTKEREKFEIISGIFGYKVVDYHSSLEVTCSRDLCEPGSKEGGKKAISDLDEAIDRYNRADNYAERNYIKRKASITYGYYNIDSALMIH